MLIPITTIDPKKKKKKKKTTVSKAWKMHCTVVDPGRRVFEVQTTPVSNDSTVLGKRNELMPTSMGLIQILVQECTHKYNI